MLKKNWKFYYYNKLTIITIFFFLNAFNDLQFKFIIFPLIAIIFFLSVFHLNCDLLSISKPQSAGGWGAIWPVVQYVFETKVKYWIHNWSKFVCDNNSNSDHSRSLLANRSFIMLLTSTNKNNCFSQNTHTHIYI